MKYRILFILSIILCILTCCGREEELPQDNLFNEDIKERPNGDWRMEEWKYDTLSTGTAYILYLTKYVQGLRYVDETFYPDGPEKSDVYFVGDRVYEMDTFATYLGAAEASQPVYYLNCYDGETGEIWHRQIRTPKLKEYPGKQQLLQRMDILGEEEYVLYLNVLNQEGKVLAYVALRTDADGKRLSATDLYPVMQENGIRIQDNYGYARVYTDQQGYFYLLNDYGLVGLEDGEILVISSEGEMIDRMGSDAPETSARYVMNDPDGNAVFEVYDSREQQLEMWGYRGTDGKKIYAQEQMEEGMSMAMSSEGYVFYGTQDGCLYRWDLYSGARELCMDYNSMGIEPSRVRIGIGTDGEPFLFQDSSSMPLICLLGTEPGIAQESIRLFCCSSNQYLNRCVTNFTLEHADCVIQTETLESYGSERKEQWTRALADLAAGKGADIYYIPIDDLEMLYEKGALADLSEMLPEEYREVIFPGALELGIIDGKLIGCAPDASVKTLVADRTMWPENHWTIKEALALQERNQEEEYYLLDSYFRRDGYGDNLQLYMYNLADSPFLDLDEGTCDFTNPLFIQVLELIKDEKNRGRKEEENSIAFSYNIDGFVSYNLSVGAYYNKVKSEEDPISTEALWTAYPYYPMGYPTENGTGSYWDCDGCVVVNKNTQHWEQVKQFLISLYDYDMQSQGAGCARRDLVGVTKHETSHPIWGDCLLYHDGFGWMHIYQNPEGGMWLEEYIEFMDSCVPVRRGTAEIENIIYEEAGGFFAGDRDAQSAAELIQNRVQLYLNERGQ